MTLSIEQTETGHVIRVQGPLDAAVAVEARDMFHDVIDNADGTVDLDMTDATFIDSSGVGAIVFLYKRLVLLSRPMTLRGLNGQPRELIGMLRLDRTIPTTPIAA